MKILFIAQTTLAKELGGPKVVLELAEAITDSGHHCTVVGPGEISNFLRANSLPIHKNYAENIATYLKHTGRKYDVIDVEARFLYKFKKEQSANYLLVARSVLFGPHFQFIKFPTRNKFKSFLKHLILQIRQKEEPFQKRIKNYYQSMNVADLINVSNHRDVEQLLRDGYDPDKILQLPYGISESRRKQFNITSQQPCSGNKIVFLGTFDFRKGCLDIPQIFKQVKNSIPDVTLTLLGAKGLFVEKADMYKFFPLELHSSIEIIPRFNEKELPEILKNFRLALFPSYIEGFPFSILENMSAGIPVIAYDSPGASSMLSERYLTQPGACNEMADKIIYYLRNEQEWNAARREMLVKSQKYNWSSIAKETISFYSRYTKNVTRENELAEG